MTFWPLVVFWIMALSGFYGSPTVLIYALFVSIPFASLAVVPPELTAGLSLTPAPVVALLMVIQCLASRDGRRWVLLACITPGMLTPLVVFWSAAVVMTFVEPHTFGDAAEAFRNPNDAGTGAAPASSVRQLFQFACLSVSVLAVMAGARLLQRPGMRQHALRAMALGAALLCMTGLLDWAARKAGSSELLAPLRTAAHVLVADGRTGHTGMVPLSGATSEPAIFGGLCVTYLATLWFFRRAVRDRRLRRASALMCLPLIAMVFLSSSLAAYAGLALLSVVSVLEALWRGACRRRGVRRHRVTRSSAGRMAAVMLGITLVCIAIPGTSVYLTGAVAHLDHGLRETDVVASGPEGFGKIGVMGALLCIGLVVAGRLRRSSKRTTGDDAWTTAWRWNVPLIVAFGLMASATPDVAPYFALLFGTSVSFRRDARMENLLRDRKRGRWGSASRPRRRRRYPGANVASAVADAGSARPNGPASAAAPGPVPPAGVASRRVPVHSWSVEGAGALDVDLGSVEGERDGHRVVERSSGPRFEIRSAPLIVLD